ncbi:hypothetical protein QF026_008455 [Streptomyces aurantiacus]|uniref:alpha/beta hydrolase n=1 Tax=Streptomyces aurantiacus TaxID=47760 RepID=UPI00278F69E3|nr:alpha/beta hydrolase [Streptomyces aurantiacus]MDQ0779989.1 hypothetical protein [Streptomyces aurantiacus]
MGAVAKLFGETFMQDSPPELVREGKNRLIRQTIITQQPVQRVAWPDLPTTYVVCANDRGTPAAAQREFSRRADKVVELQADRHPLISQPASIASVLVNL